MKNRLDKSVQITLIIVGGIMLLTLMTMGFYKSFSPGTTVSSQGFAEVEVNPDLAVVYFNVETYGKTSKEANDLNAEIVDRTKAAMTVNGFDESKIETVGFNVYPNYDYGSVREIKGYVATHTLRFEVPVGEKEKIGSAIDIGVASGATISYINFELTRENENKYKAEAIKMATEDARVKAEALASGADKKLGKVVSVSTSDFVYQPWNIFSADSGYGVAEAKAVVGTNINPGNQAVSASVVAVFKLR